MNYVKNVASFFESTYTVNALKVLIILWSIIVILAAVFIDNPYVLGLILAYEVLP